MSKKKEQDYKYKPKSYNDDNSKISNYSEEDVKKARKIVDREEEVKSTKLAKLSAIWTILSTIYAIVTTCMFIAQDWVDDTFSIVLLVILIVYIIIFVVLIALTIKNPKKAKGQLGWYKKGLKIFKAFANVVFIVLASVSMAGIAGNEMGLKEWVVFCVTFAVAFIQLAFKVSMLIFKIARKEVGKHYKVKVHRYVDGKEKKKNAIDAIEESSYK